MALMEYEDKYGIYRKSLSSYIQIFESLHNNFDEFDKKIELRN
jgi:hypothetical protein